LQLILAQLANTYFSFSEKPCGYDDTVTWCSEPDGESVADLIYAMRDPLGHKLDNDKILQMLK
jgi:hypothetical protein